MPRIEIVSLALVLGLCGPQLRADEAQEPMIRPEYSFTLKNPKLARQIFTKNAWWEQVAQTSLYQGLLMRLGPVLFSLPDTEKKEKSWSGRLIDYALEKFLDGKTVSISYFHHHKRVSPFAAIVQGLNSAEQKAFETLASQLKSGEPIEMAVATDEIRPPALKAEDVKVSVSPIELRGQRFAWVGKKGCFAISRDPGLAARMSLQCEKAPKLGEQAAILELSLREFLPALSKVVGNFVGVSDRVTFAFNWDESAARLVPADARIGLESGSILGSGSYPKTLLDAIPADSQLAVTAFLPEPANFQVETMGTYFKQPAAGLKKKKSIPLAWVYLGMSTRGPAAPSWGDEEEPGAAKKPKTRPVPLSALLISRKGGEDTLSDLNQLFGSQQGGEIRMKVLCTNVIAISKQEEALGRLASTCAKKTPSIRQLPDRLISGLEVDSSASIIVQLGRAASQALNFGWELAGEGKAPEEILASRTLLEGLPSYVFSGKRTDSQLILKGAF